MSDPDRIFEIRCPVHGFVTLNAWERDIINQPAFQRLRRIRQLAWTDLVYPGAMHTRFEHSLGVMHVASRLYKSVCQNSKELLRRENAYNDAGFTRDHQLVRLTALLHDIGHGPFSHAGEDLLPKTDNGTQFTHEDYSSAIILDELKDVIENHPLNTNYRFRADDITNLLQGSPEARQSIFWRELIDSQLDADKIDYLLRDSHHIGVSYGKFDLDRLAGTVCAVPGAEGQGLRLGVEEGGLHSAEAVVLARYFMFTQVYFHKTRLAYDIHIQECLRNLLPSGKFPSPHKRKDLKRFLSWDDWRVLGLIQSGKGGPHAESISRRDHYRQVYETPEISSTSDLKDLNKVLQSLEGLPLKEVLASKSWYKTGDPDVQILRQSPNQHAEPLSRHSAVVKNLARNNQVRVFCRPEDVSEAKNRIESTVRPSQ